PTPHTPHYTLSLHDALPISCTAPSPKHISSLLPRRSAITGERRERTAHSTWGKIPTPCPGPRSVLPSKCWRRTTSRRLSRKVTRSEEHTSELQSRGHLVCRL